VWSNQWIERYVLAHNPSAPLDVLEALSHDGIVYVRAAARENLAARAAVKEGTSDTPRLQPGACAESSQQAWI
jgi:hypothetical protein